VETSTNFAAIKPSVTPPPSSSTRVTYTYINSTRSSLPTALEAARSRIVAAANAVGAKAELNPAYSGWAPNPESPVLQLTKRAVAGVIGKEPKVRCGDSLRISECD
jgi:dipeptidase D